jgi:hypothetical protein
MPLFSKKQSTAPRRRQQSRTDQNQDRNVSAEQQYSFRRNRTLTGSASSNITSANESKAQMKSPRVQAHDLVRKRRHLGMILFMTSVFAGALLILISQFTAKVSIRAQDITMQLDPVYEHVIQEYLSRRPAERLRFLLNLSELNAYLQASAPEVSSVAVSGATGFGESNFTLTMRAPITGWSVRDGQQYVDATGTPFKRNYFAAPSVEIIDKSGVQIDSGQAVASNRFLGFVGLVVGLSRQDGYTVTQVIIPERTTRQVQLRLEGVSFPIKFSVDRRAGEQVEDMVRALKWLRARDFNPEYLDVRVGGKAFYK